MVFHTARQWFATGAEKADTPTPCRSGFLWGKRYKGLEMSANYFEKLQDPRWQKKRLEAMQAANFSCASCGNETVTLHVHHKQYFKGREPWEYDVEQLEVLCKDCHAWAHDEEDQLKIACSYVQSTGSKSRDTVASLINGVVGRPMEFSPDPEAHLVGELICALIWPHGHNFNTLLDSVELSKNNPAAIWEALSKATKEAKHA